MTYGLPWPRAVAFAAASAGVTALCVQALPDAAAPLGLLLLAAGVLLGLLSTGMGTPMTAPPGDAEQPAASRPRPARQAFPLRTQQSTSPNWTPNWAPNWAPRRHLPRIAYRGAIERGGSLRITSIGTGIESLTGWSTEAAQRPGWRQLNLDPLTLPLGPDLPERLEREDKASAEFRFRRADGAWMWVRETVRAARRIGTRVEVTGVLEDISAEQVLALQEARTAKFATLGEMAAGLAHELNQPIAIMSLAAENAAEALEAGASGLPDAVIRLHRIMAQADRAKAIVTQLRAFSRVDATALEAMDLGAAVRGMMVLAGQALRDAGVEVVLVVPDRLPRIVGQRTLVEQVLLNLVLNARDSLLDQPPECRRLHLLVEAGPEEAVTLSVVDNGAGLSPEVKDRLFEPFVTTKPPGLGTGLGLSICRTIMQAVGGRIEAGDGPEALRPFGCERGAAFTLTFRRAPGMAEAGPAARGGTASAAQERA